jgi:hypothetical protein
MIENPIEWPSTLHDGCNYPAAIIRNGLFCNKCGWGWSAWPQRMKRLTDIIDAIDALPDEGPFHLDVRNDGYSYAMREVKALLHPTTRRSKR